MPSISFRIGLFLTSAVAACPLLGANALAQQNVPETNLSESQGRCDCGSSVERNLLRYNLSYFLGSPVFKLSKDGKEIGPKFLTILPEDALEGSSEGVKHIRHARMFHWAALASGLIAVGLLSGAAIVHVNEKQWTHPAENLAGGGVAALVVGLLLGYARQEELMAAIDAYNYDVMRRK
jgi:hypothetical protein